MTLIEVLEMNNQDIKFFKGIDFDILINHPKDGKDGFIFCFIDSYQNEMLKYNRQKKIESIINKTEYLRFDWKMIENDFISIYQTESIGEDVVYETVKNKILKNQFPDMPWIPISGISKGAWKIV